MTISTTHRTKGERLRLTVSQLFRVAMIAMAAIIPFTDSEASPTQPSPRDSLPGQWSYTAEVPAVMPADDRWWRDFNDPLLDTLINMAEERNFNLAAALKRVNISRMQLNQIKSGYWPQLSVSGGYTVTKGSGRTSTPYSSTSTDTYFGLQGDLSWEIDLFGRISAQVKAGKGTVQGSRAEYASAMVSLCAEMAQDYFALVTCKEQLKVATEHIATQEEIVKMTEARYEAGLVSALDVAQAKTVVYSTQAAIPGLKARIESLRRAIATLCGLYERDLPPVVSPNTVPDCPAIRDIGIPADLLRRRPDILAAEARLATLAAQTGVAKKDFLPTLSLNGTFALQAHAFDDMFHKDAISYEVAPTLSWTVFDGLARNYKVAEAKLAFEEELDTYNLTVMTAVEEVNNAISKFQSLKEQIDVDNKVIEQNKETLRLSVERYMLGLSDFSNVVDAQVSLLENENDLITSKGSALSALVDLYKALGGGWNMVNDVK